MWWLVIPAIGIVGAWLYGAKLVATKAPPLDAFTAAGTPQVGDIATVALVSAEGTDSETSLVQDDANHSAIGNRISPADQAIFDGLDAKVASGGTAKFQLTAVHLISAGGSAAGQPVAIGVLVDPPVSARVPFGFLLGSIQKLERNGQVVTK